MRSPFTSGPFALHSPFRSRQFSPLTLSLVLFIDPSDTSTLFQDAAGTRPVTVQGDPVGLVMDKSQGLVRGPELYGDVFTTGLGTWQFTATGDSVARVGDDGQSVVLEHAGSTARAYLTAVDLRSGYHEISFSLETSSPQDQANVTVGSTSLGNFTAGDHTIRVIGGSSYGAGELRFNIYATGVSATVRNLSCRTLPGNHLTAPSDAARPTYQTGGGLHWLAFDGVDDELVAIGPLPFSTDILNCTAFRLDAFNRSFPEVISNRGPSLVPDQRHPMIYLSQSSGNIGTNIAQNNSYAFDLGGAVLNKDLVVSMQSVGMDRVYRANGVENTNSDGPVLVAGETTPFRISGGNRFSGRFYGTVQVNSTPTSNQLAAVRQWFAQRSGGIA